MAGGKITGWQNGLAISGDYLSAASFFGIAGAISLTGFGGFYLSIVFLVASLVVFLLVAEPLRNLGKYTLADMLTTSFNTSSVRSAAALSTIAISLFYMIVQLNGIGALIGLLLSFPCWLSAILIGILMTVCIVAGTMVATIYIQIVKALLLVVISPSVPTGASAPACSALAAIIAVDPLSPKNPALFSVPLGLPACVGTLSWEAGDTRPKKSNVRDSRLRSLTGISPNIDQELQEGSWRPMGH